MSWTPPCRSRPSLVDLVATATAAPAISATTAARMSSERRRSDIAEKVRPRLLRRRQDEQQPAVGVVGRKQVGDRLGRQVALGMDSYRLSQPPHAPLQRHPHLVLRAVEGQPEHVADRPPDHLLVGEAGELARAAAAADDPALLVAHEERGVRRRVVVVEELEEEAEAALRAALGLVAEALRTVAGRRSMAAVGADEQVRHLSLGRLVAPCEDRL